MRLLRRQVYEDDGHGLVAEAPGSNESLVAADDDVVIVSRDDGLEEPELPHRAGEGIELGVADLAGVGGVGVQVVDWNLDDLQVRGRCCHLPSWFPPEGEKERRP